MPRRGRCGLIVRLVVVSAALIPMSRAFLAGPGLAIENAARLSRRSASLPPDARPTININRQRRSGSGVRELRCLTKIPRWVGEMWNVMHNYCSSCGVYCWPGGGMRHLSLCESYSTKDRNNRQQSNMSECGSWGMTCDMRWPLQQYCKGQLQLTVSNTSMILVYDYSRPKKGWPVYWQGLRVQAYNTPVVGSTKCRLHTCAWSACRNAALLYDLLLS